MRILYPVPNGPMAADQCFHYKSSSLIIPLPPPLVYASLLLLLNVNLSFVPGLPLAIGVPAPDAAAVERPPAFEDASSKSCISG